MQSDRHNQTKPQHLLAAKPYIVIVLDLCCEQEHRFEGWFASADAFQDQCARKLLSCPVCSTSAVRRLPSAPYVQTRGAAPDKSPSPPAAQPAAPSASAPSSLSPAAAAAALQVLRHLSRNAENVGERLPEEARRIHYGEAEVRDIRGKASPDEVEELLEEGIMVLPLPAGEDELH